MTGTEWLGFAIAELERVQHDLPTDQPWSGRQHGRLQRAKTAVEHALEALSDEPRVAVSVRAVVP